MEGKSSIINAKTNFVHTIPIKQPTENLKVIIYQFKNFTNGVNKQIISIYQPKVTPEPDEIESFEDQLGNKGIQITFDDVSSDIRIESNFIISSEVEIIPIVDFYEYPLQSSAIDYVSIYLKETDLTPVTNLSKLQKVVNHLAQKSKNVFQITLRIISWVQNNIQFNPALFFNGAKKTFQLRKGNRKGILNLTLSMLRMAKIPCRYVHGLSINKSYMFKARNKNSAQTTNGRFFSFISNNNRNVEIKYPKSLYGWIEIYFPNRYWVPFDPTSAYFFLPSNFLRRSVSLDSGGKLDRAVSGAKDFPIEIQFFVELSKELNKMRVKNHFQKASGHFFFPTFSTKENQFVRTLFMKKKKLRLGYQLQEEEMVSISFNPFPLGFSNDKEQIELKVSPGSYYSQKVYIENDFNLDEIKLPLFRFNNAPIGKVWLELYEEANQKSHTLKLLAKSEPLNISQMKNAGEYAWITFFFDLTNLKKGNIIMILKYDTQEVILWRGLFGNPFQERDDTFYISKEKNPIQNILHLDLCFKIYGTAKEE